MGVSGWGEETCNAKKLKVSVCQRIINCTLRSNLLASCSRHVPGAVRYTIDLIRCIDAAECRCECYEHLIF